jgi:O-antigen ligase
MLDRAVRDDRLAVRAVVVAVAGMPFLRPAIGTLTPADVLIGIAVISAVLWLGTYRLPAKFPFAAPVGLMVIAGTLAAGLGNYPITGATAIAQDLALFAWCAAVANVCRTPEALSAVLRAWTASAVVWSLVLVAASVAWIPAVSGQTVQGGRAALFFVTPNQAGNYFALSLMVLLASPWPRRRLTRGLAAVAIGSALIFTASNAAIGGLLAALLVVWLLGVAQRSGVVQALAASTVVVALVSIVALVVIRYDVIDAARESQTMLVRNTIGRTERSAEDRFVKIDQLQSLYRTGGLIGYGPAATEAVLSEGTHANAKSAHNDYIATVVERGVVGALGLVLLVATLGAMAAGMAVRPARPEFAGAIRSARPLVGALIVVALGALSHEVLHFRQEWTLFGLVAALHLWARPAGDGVVQVQEGGVS